MKNIFHATSLRLYLIVLTTLSILSGCGDKCNDVDCQNGGTCIDGTCSCPDGYTGSDCQTVTRDLYLGTYNVTESCPNLSTYTVNIFADTSSLFNVNIANFSNLFSNPVNAEVSGLSITIPIQSPDNDGRTVSGNGNFLAPDKIIWQFSVNGSNGYSCSNSEWIKQ